MRLRIELNVPDGKKPAVKAIRQLIYQVLNTVDKEYTTWLHDWGYEYRAPRLNGPGPDGNDYTPNKIKAVKPFVYSHPYVVHTENRGDVFMFKLASPDREFLAKFSLGVTAMTDQAADGISIANITKMPDPEIYGTAEVKKQYFCLSPVCVLGRAGNSHATAAAEAVVDNLFRSVTAKWMSVTGENIALRYDRTVDSMVPVPFQIEFVHPEVRMNNMGMTQIPVVMSPFTLTTTNKVHTAMLELGLGQKNAVGFGMVEEVRKQRF